MWFRWTLEYLIRTLATEGRICRSCETSESNVDGIQCIQVECTASGRRYRRYHRQTNSSADFSCHRCRWSRSCTIDLHVSSLRQIHSLSYRESVSRCTEFTRIEVLREYLSS